MSFLAQLRQNSPQAKRGSRLCYLLEIEHTSQTLLLDLSLVVLSGFQILEVVKSYSIQREHLQHPPPFINQSDIELLRLLVDADPGWQQQTCGRLPEQGIENILTSMLETERCFIKSPQGIWQKITFANPVAIELQWKRTITGSHQLDWFCNNEVRLITLNSGALLPIAYSLTNRTLAFVTHSLNDNALSELRNTTHHLPASAIGSFLSDKKEYWTKLGLPLPQVTALQECEAEFSPMLYFSSQVNSQGSGGVECRVSLMFCYSNQYYCCRILSRLALSYPASCCPDVSYPELDAFDYWDGTSTIRLKRKPELEAHYLRQLLPFMTGLIPSEQVAEWRGIEGEPWLKILTDSRSQLEQMGFRFLVAANFRYHYVLADNWSLMIEEADKNELQLKLLAGVQGEQQNLFELLGQLRIFNKDNNILTLADGRLVLLPRSKISGIIQELGDLLVNQSGTVRLPLSQVNRLESLRKQLPETTQWQGATKYIDLSNNLHKTPRVLKQINRVVNAELRPYQWLGVCWLQHLKQHGLNGLLADDMGLGKTLQTLANLSLEKIQGNLNYPALIVAPTSLLYNWEAEIKRFTPRLCFKIVHGAKRQEAWSNLDNYDIIITSYKLIINDLEHWQKQPLSWIILDEAQQIKNPRTKISQALRKLESENRLCLSGTPVENHLGELWSQLDFLMPGCLGNASDFRRLFQKPIEQETNELRMTQLQQRIAPFILRRTKQQVAKELPLKTEIYQYINLNEKQREFYKQQKELAQSELQVQLEQNEHAGQQQIFLLSILMKLRQICCDPALLGESNIKSSKRLHCIEMIQELVEEKRTILLFSQFTSMLDLLAGDLDELGIKYLKLTGKTRDRQKLINKFQKGNFPIFLISLKAGGVGLNLTQADTVIHYDPWWNNAAEQQATDRAHRIGQDKPVFVYKLISEDTIENKIAELQQYKANISHHINHQAQLSGEKFALNLESLLNLWQQETKTK